MHRLPSRYSVRRFRISSWLFIARWLLVLAGVGYLLHAMALHVFHSALVSVGILAGALVVGFLQCVVSTRACCPLCLAHPIGSRTCAKHRRARPALGSHRLRVAGNIILNGYFRCPYCGELTAVKTRSDS